MTTLAHARTWLFVPGNAPARFPKAAGSGADAVILDLEDAVRPEDKDVARSAVVDWLEAGNAGWVRVNASGSEAFAADVAALSSAPGLLGVVLPKAEDSDPIIAVSESRTTGLPVVALVETARGVSRAANLAATPGVARLAFGSLDFAVDIAAAHEPEALLLARSTLVLASRASGLPAPIDGVSTAVHDDGLVAEEARRSRALGFGGKLCIHPAQLAVTAAAFAPSEDEIRWAREVLAAGASSTGVATGPDGHMIDKPVLDRARSILQS